MKMIRTSQLTLGEKLMQVRRAKGISQDSVAYVIKSNKSFVHRLEYGQADCNDDMLKQIRRYLEIENAPILEHELQLYINRLWLLYEKLATHKAEDARVLLDELSPVLDLPYEDDLRLLFLLLEVRMFIRESNFEVAQAKLNELEPLMVDASNEALCMLHRSKGFFCALRGASKEALKHYLQALAIESDYVKPDITLLTNIGMLYASIGKPYQGIASLERAMREFGGPHGASSYTKSVLGMAYVIIGEYSKAKELFDSSLIYAKGLNDRTEQGLTLVNMSVLNMRMGNYDECVSLCNQALECYGVDEPHSKITLVGQKNAARCTALFNKGNALVKLKDYAQCQEVIAYGRSLLDNNEKFIVGFNVLECFITIDNADSIKYLEEVAIPYFKAGDGLDKVVALDICKELEMHFTKKRAKTKAQAFGCIARDVYEDMFIGDVDFG